MKTFRKGQRVIVSLIGGTPFLATVLEDAVAPGRLQVIDDEGRRCAPSSSVVEAEGFEPEDSGVTPKRLAELSGESVLRQTAERAFEAGRRLGAEGVPVTGYSTFDEWWDGWR